MAAPSPAGSYEERECRRCDRGRVNADAFTARMVPCAGCGGTGRMTVYLYPKVPGRRISPGR